MLLATTEPSQTSSPVENALNFSPCSSFKPKCWSAHRILRRRTDHSFN